MDDTGELDLHAEIQVRSESASEDVLTYFFAHFYFRDDSSTEHEVGSIMGWMVWSVGTDSVADAADEVSADSSYI